MPSLRFELDAEMEDGKTFSVVADQRDIAKFEIQPFGRTMVAMEDDIPMVFFRYLAWSAATRQQLTELKWEEFDAQCIEALPPDEPKEAPADSEDPSNPAP